MPDIDTGSTFLDSFIIGDIQPDLHHVQEVLDGVERAERRRERWERAFDTSTLVVDGEAGSATIESDVLPDVSQTFPLGQFRDVLTKWFDFLRGLDQQPVEGDSIR